MGMAPVSAAADMAAALAIGFVAGVWFSSSLSCRLLLLFVVVLLSSSGEFVGVIRAPAP